MNDLKTVNDGNVRLMIARTSLRWARAGRRTSSKAIHIRQTRTCSSASPSSGNVSNQSSTALLAGISAELDKISPRFDVPASAIEILQSPTQFYDALKDRIAHAKTRIFLATLYVGKSEYELIDTIRTALKRNPDLKVSLLTDALRGTREAPSPSCASLLASLITEFGDRVEVRLFHTPNLSGVRKALLPKRINEGWGLQHMKLYGIDDEIIMSGANLSDDYFTNRQDRYHVLKSREVTDYFHDVFNSICQLSFRVRPSKKDPSGFMQEWPASNVQPSPLEDAKSFIASATKAVQTLFRRPQRSSPQRVTTDTQIYPLLQFTPILQPDVSTELPVLTAILRKLSEQAHAGSRWTFTAGYFNMTPEVRQLLLQSKPDSATVIAASPWANGFYGSKGVSGMLPSAYTYLSRRFLGAVAQAGLAERITLKEWRRGTVNTPGGWTYHAKGVWITLPKEEHPSISLVGSSNYTKRSYSLDLEANTLIVTRNADLQRRLGEEERWLQEYASPMKMEDYAKTERRVGLHVRIAMAIVTLLGGAL